jgi:hypothetical protein
MVSITIEIIVKSTISMGHGFKSYVTNYQRVCNNPQNSSLICESMESKADIVGSGAVEPHIVADVS